MEPKLTYEEALTAINRLRSNVISTQNAGWSNLMYPLVAILNDAGFDLIEDPPEDDLKQHLHCYGGAGGYPGNELQEDYSGFSTGIGRLQSIKEMAQRVADDPSEENLGYLRARLK